MKILLLTRYGRLGASSRLRAYQYLPYLQSKGLEITTLPLLGDYYQEDLNLRRPRRWGRIAAAYLLRLLRLASSATYDLVWIESELFPWLPAVAERLLSGLRIPYVVEYDDPIYHRYDLHPSRIVRLLLGKKIDVIMRGASTVIVGNDYLGQRAGAAGARRVERLPTVVDLERYPATSPRDEALFTVGWIGSSSTVKYLSAIGPVLANFCRDHHARLVVVGAREAELEGVQAKFRPWSEATEVEDILSFDVGIMPLADEPLARGKCGYKLIQYMACALPVIASPVGVNQGIVEHGVNGFLASTDQEWRSALETLFAAPDLRARMGSAGRRKVELSYCTRVTAPILAAILTHAVTPVRDPRIP
jgi:glycosyltransferase involved in cell wall biosynthesis